MIVTLCAILALRQANLNQTPGAQLAPPAQQANPLQDPMFNSPSGELVKKMIQHYRDAKSLGGKVKLTQSAKGFSISIESTVAYDHPDKLLIRQVKNGGTPGSWLILSDGKIFSYAKPEGVIGPERLREPVDQRAGHQDVQEMYGASAASLGDRSPAIDLLIGRNQDLEVIVPRWRSMKLGTPTKIRGVDVQIVEGDYSEVIGGDATGKFMLAISADGDLLRYTTTNRYQAPTNPPQVIDVISVWDVDVKLNQPNTPETYKGN